jgi:predicted TIM-barrel fold metal-dependent hydrolase
MANGAERVPEQCNNIEEQTMQATTTAHAGRSHMAVRKDWLERRQEAAILPELKIVDPHHHLIDRPETGRYLLPDILEDIGCGHNVVATVYIEWLSMYRADGPVEMRPVGEVEFANGVAAMSASGGYGKPRLCAGIIAHADLSLGAGVARVLEAMMVAGGGRLRGIRYMAASDPDQAAWGAPVRRPEGMLLDSKVRQGFSRLAPLGLTFEAWVYHPQLGDLLDLARAFPTTRIALNHVGGPIGLGRYQGKRKEVFADWSERIRELAACPNVYAKLGGLGMPMFGFEFEEAELPPSSAELATAWRPYIETAISAFGPSRCMFESNFPVDKTSYSYGVFWNACKRLVEGASRSEKADLFSETASRFYRLNA